MISLILGFLVFGFFHGENAIRYLYQEQGESSRQKTVHRLPFILDRIKIILPVRVGESRSLNVILDTGMAFNGLFLYKKELIEELRFDDTTQYQIGGAGNQSTSTAVTKDSMTFTIGSMTFTNQRIVILNNDRFKGFPSDGVVGYSIFGDHDVIIDYDATVITLHQPASLMPDTSWYPIPVFFKENRIPWVEATVNVLGDKDVPISLYIDLASGEAVELLLREKMKFTLPNSLEPYYLGRGVSGDIHGYRGKIERFRLGPYVLQNVSTAFAPAEVRSKQRDADGVLANNALRRFNLIFSYSTNKLYLKPNTYYHQPFQ